MPVDLTRFAVGGATRPDSFSGMNPAFSQALMQFFAAAPPEVQAQMRISSGYRSPDRQAQLWAEALKKYGSPEAARKWVAPPGRSQHNHGHAADMKWLNPAAMAWAHANAPKFGLAFPLKNENWHIELASARGGKPTSAPMTLPSAVPTVSDSQRSPYVPPAIPNQPAAPVMPESSLASMFVDGFAQPQQVQEGPSPAQLRRARLERMFAGVDAAFA